jgi:hypothetical protein
MNHPPRNKQRHIVAPPFADEPTADALPLLKGGLREGEPSLRVDEHADDVHSLLEGNARLRGVLVQLSDLIRRNVVLVR